MTYLLVCKRTAHFDECLMKRKNVLLPLIKVSDERNIECWDSLLISWLEEHFPLKIDTKCSLWTKSRFFWVITYSNIDEKIRK